jgi:hypothetical protein
MINLDQSADVIWVPADQVPETGVNAPPNQRHFDSLRQAITFAMDELTIADREARIAPLNKSRTCRILGYTD